jgi:hypothetical protein
MLASIRSLVVPGMFETIETGLLAKQFIKDDLPEFAGPMMETLNPSLIFSEF